MSKNLRIVTWSAGVVLLLLIIGGIVLYLSLDEILRSTAESETASSLNLPTHLGAVNLSLTGRTLALNDLRIGSPQGYAAPQFFTMQDASVRVSLRQLMSDPIHIAEVTLSGPLLVVEQVDGRFNIQTVTDQLPETDPDDELVQLVIDRLSVTNATVIIRPGIPHLPEELTVPLPSIEMEGIGTADEARNGIAIREVVMQVVGTMAAQASESDMVPAELRQLLQLNVAAIAGEVGEEVRRQVERVSEEVGQVVDEVLRDPERLMEEPEAVQERLRGLIDRDPVRDPLRRDPEPEPRAE